MQTRIDTTFSGKDISSAVSVYEYTVPASGMYSFQVRLAAVAGDDDYEVYLTLNDGDAQSDDMVAPKTTATLASGQTAVWFSTIKVAALVGDVINVFVLGVAGDTDEAGSVRIFSENYAVAGDEMDLVDAPNATSVTAIQDGLATPSDVTTTLAVSATEAAALASNEFPFYQSYTFSQAVTSTLTDDLSAATKIWLAVKKSISDEDSESLIYIEETLGLTYLNQAAYTTAAHGSLTVTGSSGAWVITIKVEENATDLFEFFGTYPIEIKAIVDSDTVYVSGGAAPISRRVVQAIA